MASFWNGSTQKCSSGQGGKEWFQLSTFPQSGVFHIFKKVWMYIQNEKIIEGAVGRSEHCAMGTPVAYGFREGFCEVLSMPRPGRGVGFGQAEWGRKGARNRAQCGHRPGNAGESTQSLCQELKEDQCGLSIQGGQAPGEGRGRRGTQGQGAWNLEPVLGNQAAGRQQVAAKLSWEQKKCPSQVAHGAS